MNRTHNVNNGLRTIAAREYAARQATERAAIAERNRAALAAVVAGTFDRFPSEAGQAGEGCGY